MGGRMQSQHGTKFCLIDGVEAAEQSLSHKGHSGHQKLDFTESYIYYIFIYVHKTYMFLLKRGTLLPLYFVWIASYPCLFTFYCPDKHCDQMQIGEDITVYSLSWREARAGAWSQKLKQKHGQKPLLLSVVCSGFFPIQLRTTCLGRHHTAIFVKKTLHRLVCFLNWYSLFSDDPKFCQVDKSKNKNLHTRPLILVLWGHYSIMRTALSWYDRMT